MFTAVERIVKDIIRNVVNVDDRQFGFMLGRGTTDAIFNLGQIQENTSQRIVIFTLPLLTWKSAVTGCPERSYDEASRKVDIPEWIVRVV